MSEVCVCVRYACSPTELLAVTELGVDVAIDGRDPVYEALNFVLRHLWKINTHSITDQYKINHGSITDNRKPACKHTTRLHTHAHTHSRTHTHPHTHTLTHEHTRTNADTQVSPKTCIKRSYTPT